MNTDTATTSELTRVQVQAHRDGVVMRGGGGALRLVQQRRTATCLRLALVPDRALLLAGDDIELQISVAAGTHLHLVETSGTVAYDMRGGRARWRLRADIGPGARWTHQTLPWVSAQGSDVERDLVVDLADDAVAVIRETLVLGRHGEQPGRLRSRTVVRRETDEVLVEDLDAAALSPYRVLDSVLAFGPVGQDVGSEQTSASPAPALSPTTATPALTTRLVTAWGDVVHRTLADAAHQAGSDVDRLWDDLQRSEAGVQSL